MLTKFYRIGAAHQVIEKSYVVSGLSAGELERTFRVTHPGLFSIATDDGNPSQIRLASAPVWLGDFSARENLFSAMAAEQTLLQRSAESMGGRLLPGAFDLEGTSDPTLLVADVHRLFPDDEVEQSLYCQVLRENLPLLVAALGRALASPAGMEQVQSTRILNGAQFAAKNWPVTSARHLARAEQHFRQSQGMHSLASLDLYPGHDGTGKLHVTLTALDAQVWLSSVRGTTILLQALFLRARRQARDGRVGGWKPQREFELERSRAAADGPYASLGKGRRTAGSAWIELILSLRREFKVLEVQYPEFEGLVLGAILRATGKGAVQSENDALRTLLGPSGTGGRFLQDIAAECISNTMGNPVREMNRRRYSDTAAELEGWWTRWLAGDSDLPPLLPSEGPAPARSPDRKHVNTSGSGREALSKPKNTTPRPTDQNARQLTQFLERWNSFPLDCTLHTRIALLIEFKSLGKQFGKSIASLADEERKVLRASVRKIATKEFNVRAAENVSGAPQLKQACDQAMSSGSCLLRLETKEGSQEEMRQRSAQAIGSLPEAVIAYSLLSLTKGPVWREELLLLTDMEEVRYGQ